MKPTNILTVLLLGLLAITPSVGLRVETDFEGNVKRIAGFSPDKISGRLYLGKAELAQFSIDPNQVRSFSQTSGSR